ncbi:hypothetical protein L9F63_016838, partial [Diploptera punctata]
MNSSTQFMPPVLDYRWNGFKLIKTTRGKGFDKKNTVPIVFQDDIWETTLSVVAENDAYIVLCESIYPNNKKSNCYWVILGGWPGNLDKGSAIRRCPDGVYSPTDECKQNQNLTS